MPGKTPELIENSGIYLEKFEKVVGKTAGFFNICFS